MDLETWARLKSFVLNRSGVISSEFEARDPSNPFEFVNEKCMLRCKPNYHPILTVLIDPLGKRPIQVQSCLINSCKAGNAASPDACEVPYSYAERKTNWVSQGHKILSEHNYFYTRLNENWPPKIFSDTLHQDLYPLLCDQPGFYSTWLQFAATTPEKSLEQSCLSVGCKTWNSQMLDPIERIDREMVGLSKITSDFRASEGLSMTLILDPIRL
jgi:hypothetical protein